MFQSRRFFQCFYCDERLFKALWIRRDLIKHSPFICLIKWNCIAVHERWLEQTDRCESSLTLNGFVYGGGLASTRASASLCAVGCAFSWLFQLFVQMLLLALLFSLYAPLRVCFPVELKRRVGCRRWLSLWYALGVIRATCRCKVYWL